MQTPFREIAHDTTFRPLLAFAAEDVALVVVALVAIGLLGLFLSMRKKLRDSIVQKTKAEVCGELLDRAARSRATLVKLATYQDAGKMKFVRAPCDVPELVSRVAATFRIQAAGKDISIAASSPAMPRLLLDEERVRQILVNLAGNAVKFTKKGGVDLSASFVPDVAPDAGLRPGVSEPPRPGRRGTLAIAVRDTGVGIAPEDQKRVMDPFVQIGASGTGGTGLGLTICKRLAERMGGELRLESEPGVGSTFTVVLPGVEVSAEAPAAAPAAPRPAAAPVRSVLVVDDVPVNLLVEKALLQRTGVSEIQTAPSGAAALEALERHGAFDLVLSDLWMPKMDGYALCAALRADARWKALRVYAVTADVEARKLAVDRGFDGLLLKPLTSDSLARFLTDLLPPAA